MEQLRSSVSTEDRKVEVGNESVFLIVHSCFNLTSAQIVLSVKANKKP